MPVSGLSLTSPVGTWRHTSSALRCEVSHELCVSRLECDKEAHQLWWNTRVGGCSKHGKVVRVMTVISVYHPSRVTLVHNAMSFRFLALILVVSPTRSLLAVALPWVQPAVPRQWTRFAVILLVRSLRPRGLVSLPQVFPKASCHRLSLFCSRLTQALGGLRPHIF